VDFLNQFVSSSAFMPHGHCFLWLPSLLWLHAVSDAIVGAAYLLIPISLVWFYRRRPDIPFRWIFVIFAAFIVACGATHVIEVWTLWVPSYWLQGGVKALTAALSVLAAFSLVKAMPALMIIPSPTSLNEEVLARRRAESELQTVNEDLDRRVRMRTAELEAANAGLQREVAERFRAEQALRESGEQLRTLVGHAPEAIVVLDMSRGRFVLVNENACRLFGLPREELLLRHPVELSADVQPDGRLAAESARGKLEAALRGETPVFEWMHRDVHGADILCEIRLVRLPSSDAPLIRGSIIDIRGRKAMENAQRESEAKFATVFHSCPEPITIGLFPDGNLIDVNEAFEHHFGWRREEILGQTGVALGIWAHSEQRDEMARRLERDAGVDNFEAELQRRDGSRLIGQISAAVTEINGRRSVLIVLRDVTLERRAERGLRESEARFATVFRTCPESISFSLLEDGTYLEVNEAYERLFGYARSEVIGHSAVSLGLWVDKSRREALLERLRSEGRVNGFEAQFRRKDGQVWDSELSAEAAVLDGKLAVVIVLRDVTAQKRAAEALRKSEEKFSKVFHTCPETIAIATLAEGIYLEVNEAFERLYGVPRNEAIGRSSLALGLWADPDNRKELVHRLEHNVRVTGFPVLIRHRSGEVKATDVSAERIEIDGRDCLIAVVRDVSEQRRAENEILRLNVELEERVRLRTAELEVANKELESFSYSVSHDLRAPLRSVHGFSQALLEDCGAQLDANGRQHIARIQAAAQRMGQLIDDLLQLSRVTRSEMLLQPVDLSALAREVVQDLRNAEPSRRVDVVIQDGLQCTGDPRLLRVVLENLLGNAWKFTSRRDGARIEFGLRPVRGNVFWLRDNGAGFDMAFVSKLFGAFQRLHGAKEFPGTGIGLATVHRIVRRHGGTIWAEGAVDHGATFYFTLGRGDEQA